MRRSGTIVATSILWLIAVFLGSFSVFSFDSDRSGDLVFCPLQRMWVPKAAPPVVKTPISEICALPATKAAFLFRVSSKQTPTEKAFFTARKEGNGLLFAFPPQPQAPEAPALTLGRNAPGTTSDSTPLPACTPCELAIADVGPAAIFCSPAVYRSVPRAVLRPSARKNSSRAPPYFV